MQTSSEQLKSVYECIKNKGYGVSANKIGEIVGMTNNEVYQRCQTMIKRKMLSRSKSEKTVYYKVTDAKPDFSHLMTRAEENQRRVLEYINQSSHKLSGNYIAEVFEVATGRSNPWLKSLVNKGLVKRELHRIGMANTAYYWTGSNEKELYRVGEDLKKKQFKKVVESEYKCQEMKDLAARAELSKIAHNAFNVSMPV